MRVLLLIDVLSLFQFAKLLAIQVISTLGFDRMLRVYTFRPSRAAKTIRNEAYTQAFSFAGPLFSNSVVDTAWWLYTLLPYDRS